MKRCLEIIIGLFSILVFTPIFAQDSYPDCTNPKIISVPLKEEFNNKVQDEIYYQPADKYTYWYRINVDADAEISYKLDLINNDDLYDLIIYNYKGDNFCNESFNFSCSSCTIAPFSLRFFAVKLSIISVECTTSLIFS